MYTLIWNRADTQGSIQMGVFESEASARAAIKNALLELVAQCATDEDEIEIRAGSWTVEHDKP